MMAMFEMLKTEKAHKLCGTTVVYGWQRDNGQWWAVLNRIYIPFWVS